MFHKRIIFIMVVLIFVNISCAETIKVNCTDEEEMQALTEASTLKDWDSVYKSFKRYAHCDDGAIWEGYSDTVGRLLADDWMHFKRLYELCSLDSAFKQFILKHIDMTVPVDVLKKIINNTRLQCPLEYKSLCKEIETAASVGWNPNPK